MSEWKAGDWAAVKIIGPRMGPHHLCIKNADGFDVVAASALHPLPAMAPEDAAVLRAAERWEGRCFRSIADDNLGDGFTPEAITLVRAVRARNTAHTPAPQQETKMNEELFVPPRDQSVAEQICLALEYAHDTLEHWGEGKFGISIINNALEHARLAQMPNEPPSSLNIPALERAVVEAAMEQGRQALWEPMGRDDGADEYDAAVSATTAAAKTLNAALNLAPVDPMAQLREAVERAIIALNGLGMTLTTARLDGSADYAKSTAKHLRAALAAIQSSKEPN